MPESAELAGEDFLLDGIRTGDQMIFARWLSLAEGRLRDSLRPFATRVDVEAVLQESLVRVWQVAPRFVPDGRPDALLRLAIRIARNLAIIFSFSAKAFSLSSSAFSRVSSSAFR